MRANQDQKLWLIMFGEYADMRTAGVMLGTEEEVKNYVGELNGVRPKNHDVFYYQETDELHSVADVFPEHGLIKGEVVPQSLQIISCDHSTGYTLNEDRRLAMCNKCGTVFPQYIIR